MPLPTFTSKTDGVDDVLASHVNDIQTEIIAIAKGVGLADYVDTETLAATKTFTDTDGPLQYLDPGGASRDVNLPAEASTNNPFIIVNTADAAENLVVKSDAPATIITIGQNQIGYLWSNGTVWRGALLTEEAGGGVGTNLLINGNMDVWQRGTSFTAATNPLNSDDTYLMDRWILLSDGNDIVDVSQQTASPPSGSLYFARADVQTINKKFGFITFLENKDAVKLQGKTVSLSFQAKTTAAAIRHIRAAVLSWTGTADAPTSDVVSSWGAEGANPTLAASLTAENVAADLTLTTAFQTFAIEGIVMDTAGITNVAVFIWVDDELAPPNPKLTMPR